MKTGRNSRCTCGSGLKYKLCCGPKAERASSRTQLFLIAGVVIVGAFILIMQVFSSKNADPAVAPAAPAPAGAANPLATQPPGPAPEGKVWSAEHGHWHDAQPNQQAGQPAIQPVAPATQGQTQANTPQPLGPAPEGKVWSAEHGHWHDAPKN